MTCADVLDLDIGNTRTKWRCGALAGALPAPELPALPAKPRRVRIANVGGDRGALAATVRRSYGVSAEFAVVTPTLGGVRCGYRQPEQLGIDRWLATVAAWRQTRTATVVVAAGTAITVDFVAADGRHLGGYIAPGLALLAAALRRGTADPRIHAAAAPPSQDAPRRNGAPGALPVGTPGRTTGEAVASGVATMLVGFLEAAMSGAADAEVFLTGGDAPALAAVWQRPLRQVPTLVLDGLAIALP